MKKNEYRLNLGAIYNKKVLSQQKANEEADGENQYLYNTDFRNYLGRK